MLEESLRKPEEEDAGNKELARTELDKPA